MNDQPERSRAGGSGSAAGSSARRRRSAAPSPISWSSASSTSRDARRDRGGADPRRSRPRCRGEDRRRGRRRPLRQVDHARRGEGGGRGRGGEGPGAGREAARASTAQKPFVVLVVGVNGSGKTTTIGKLAAKLHAEGRSVMLAAGDTFRAAAIDQLKIWGGRSGAHGHRARAGLGRRRPRLRRAHAKRAARRSTCCWSTPPAACRTRRC